MFFLVLTEKYSFKGSNLTNLASTSEIGKVIQERSYETKAILKLLRKYINYRYVGLSKQRSSEKD